MKVLGRIIAISTLIALSCGAIAKDITKGTLAIGGDLAISYSSTKSTYPNGNSLTRSSFKDTVSANYYLIDNFALGFAGTVSNTTTKDDTDTYKNNYVMISFLGHKDIPINEKYNLFFEGGFGFGLGSSETNNVVMSTYDVAGFDLTGGVSIFEDEGYSIAPYVSWGSANIEYDDDPSMTVENSGFSFGFSVTVYTGL